MICKFLVLKLLENKFYQFSIFDCFKAKLFSKGK